MAFAPSSIRGSLRKVLPHLKEAKDQSLNEADTVQRIIMVLEKVFEYDPLSEVSRETVIKGKFADIAVKLNGTTKFLVEAKSAATEIRDIHIDQARLYAADAALPWVVLTNGTTWTLYHLTFDEGIESDRVFTVDLIDQELDHVAPLLGWLHRDCVRKGGLDEFWQHRSALTAQSLGRALFTEGVLRQIRREIRRERRISVEEEKLVTALKELFSGEAREAMGPVKVRRRRKRVQKPVVAAEVATSATPAASQSPNKAAVAGSGT